MNQSIHLEPAQVPRHIRIGYTGRKYQAQVTDSVTLHDTSCGGGTKSSYTCIELTTGQAKPMPGNPAPYQFGGNMEGKTVPIPAGFAVVEHHIFCGKDMGLTYYLNSADAQSLLPAPDLLTMAEQIVLAATRTYKNTYGGRTNIRYHEASRETGIEEHDWETAKKVLISRKLLNKAGSITVAGKNAIGRIELLQLRAIGVPQ